MKINYDLEMNKIIEKLDTKPRLLIHSCCGPCSTAVLERLVKYFEIDILFFNPNLDSKDEFDKRVIEQKKVIAHVEKNNDAKIGIVTVPYNHDEFLKIANGLEEEREGGKRCMRCYYLRLKKAGEYAKVHGYDYFTTTLSISPHKNSQVLNEMGISLGEKLGVSYLVSDFKKKNGFKRSVEISEELHLYRQDYCGCEFSKIEAMERKK
ncbi:epoxyqueuosine reductase QueH [Peptoniphilus sp.]|uniref:epoxyqueuosine reductase QueH n=1 Tax=Peptoniphilus sp. TaxID=1971214 RepID=UPI0039943572